MRLKQIRLAGFKSFVDATTIPFPEAMTAIVGPNGCGKSNVIDAVRWVLGESSAKNLRGDAMTDVIFNGSSKRKPVSQASVELVFENCDERLAGSLGARNEVAVKRLVTRDGLSTYYLNGSKCRRRDITDIFLGTGLGPRSYAIIEQGMISRLIESKPQDLRVFLEEAAGISKYKERRRETETRIRHTRDNLDRLNDVRDELGAQLERLQKQAANAKRFKALKQEERQLKRELLVMRWLHNVDQQQQAELKLLQMQTELERFVAEHQHSQSHIVALREQQQDLQADVEQKLQRLYQVNGQVSQNEQQLKFLQQQLLSDQQQLHKLAESKRQNLDQQQLLDAQLAEQHELVAELQFQSVTNQEQVLELQTEVAELELQLSELASRQLAEQQALLAQERARHQQQQQRQQWQFQLQQAQHLAERCQQQLAQLPLAETAQQLSALNAQLAHQQQQLNLTQGEAAAAEQQLAQGQSECANAREAWQQAQQQLQQLHWQTEQTEQQIARWQAQQNSSSPLQSSAPTQAEPLWLAQCQVEPRYQTAFAAVVVGLEHASLVTEPRFTADAASSHAWVHNAVSRAERPSLAAVCQGAIPAWFAAVAVAEQLSQVPELLPHYALVVTIDGDLYQSGSMRQPLRSSDTGVALQLQAQQQLQTLSAQLPLQQSRVEAAEQALAMAEQALQTLAAQVKTANELHSTAQKQWYDIKQQHGLASQQQQQWQSQQHKWQDELQQAIDSAEQCQTELLLLDEAPQLQQLELDHELAEQKQQVELTLGQRRQQLQHTQQLAHQTQLQWQTAKHQAQVQQQQLAQLQQSLQYLQEQLLDVQQRLAESLPEQELLQEQVVQSVELCAQADEALQLARQQLSEVDAHLKALSGSQTEVDQRLAVQRDAINQQQLAVHSCQIKAQTLLEQMTEQDMDLTAALPELPADAEESKWLARQEEVGRAVARLGAINLAAIEEYDAQAERKGYLDSQYQDLVDALETLEAAIRKIDKETKQRFRDTFEQVNTDLQHLFPKVFGGGSAYLELTDDDLLETGVTIMARPPGKKNSTIHLLSGGEKALTALSLVFSIFRLNPAPFCMLDEVDAPLDDANVGRFCNLVREMSDSVQFIYISHNKIAMEMASQLTGVTMQEPGVSRMVAVDIEQAVKMVENA